MSDRPAESFSETVARLASAQKKAAPGSPPYSIIVNRPVGRRIAAGAYRAGLTPNGVTAISAAVTFTGIILIATVPPSIALGLGVWLLLALGYAFDSADGQVARLRGGGSLAGEWLDHVVDAAKIASLHSAVLIAAYRFFDLADPLLLLIPIGFVIVATVNFFAMILNDQLRAIAALRRGARPAARTGSSGPLRMILLLPTDYGILCLSFVLLGLPWLVFSVYMVLFVAAAGYLTLAAIKWFREMGALDALSAEPIGDATPANASSVPGT